MNLAPMLYVYLAFALLLVTKPATKTEKHSNILANNTILYWKWVQQLYKSVCGWYMV